jgi:hypothetical protein
VYRCPWAMKVCPSVLASATPPQAVWRTQ